VIENNVTGVSFGPRGSVRLFWDLDLSTMSSTSEWTTYFNLVSEASKVTGLRPLERVNWCCPKVSNNHSCYLYLLYNIQVILQHPHLRDVEPRGNIKRINCDISESEFVEKYVRTMTPVIITGCDYKWFQKRFDTTVSGIVRVRKQLIVTSPY
jgi:hypothetical protein